MAAVTIWTFYGCTQNFLSGRKTILPSVFKQCDLQSRVFELVKSLKYQIFISFMILFYYVDITEKC